MNPSFNAFSSSGISSAALSAALSAKLDKAGGTMTGAVAVTPGALTTTGLRLAQQWNSVGTTCRGFEVAITNTNSASASTLMRVCGGAAGTAQAMAVSPIGSLSVGMSDNAATFTLQGSDRSAILGLSAFGNEFSSANFHLATSNARLRFTDGNASTRYGTIYGEAANVLALRDGSAGTTGAAWEMLEMTAPAAPSADRVRLYAEDNGSGKTRLVLKWSDGSTFVIATQP